MDCKKLYKYYQDGRTYIFDLIISSEKSGEHTYKLYPTFNLLGYIV